MKRKICAVTGTRAEYGLLRWTMDEIRQRAGLSLHIVATGMHLSPRFGSTVREIVEHGFKVDREVEMLIDGDTGTAAVKSMGVGLIGFADAFAELRPDIVLILGDRYEILAAAIAAMISRIPIAHAHGGETTEGAFDDAIRHAVTKMARLHFVAAEPYRQRVLQLGEAPDAVFVVGGLGLDGLERLTLLNRTELERSLDFALGAKNLLVTFHPATLDERASAVQVRELLAALDELSGTHVIFTMPNADPDSAAIIDLVTEFCRTRPHAKAFWSLGQLRYLSCLRHVDAVVGNSSSGLLEAPSLRTPTVNIGDRQRGRLKAASVVDCDADRASIRDAIARCYDVGFRATLRDVTNPYGVPGACRKIADVLETCDLGSLRRKRFHDLWPSAMGGSLPPGAFIDGEPLRPDLNLTKPTRDGS